jgi:hypothetical protein
MLRGSQGANLRDLTRCIKLPGHSFLDVGSGCGILTCLGAKLVHPGGEARGIDIRQSAITFSLRNMQESCNLLRRSISGRAAFQIGSACFQGTVVRALQPDFLKHAQDLATTTPVRDAGAASADPEAPRLVMQVTADLGQETFEAVMAHVQSSCLASSGAVWTRCVGTFLPEGSVRLEEVEVLQVMTRAAGSSRKAPVEYVLRLSADGTLCGTYASRCGETGTCKLEPVDVSSTLAALEQCVVFEKANVFHTHKAYDRIHVGANIPTERNRDLFKLLKPGGLLVGPMGDRMVLVTRPIQSAQKGEVEDFFVRETMHVRYGDLIVPEKEEEELRSESQRTARPPLQGRSAGDMLVCRACCCPIAPADAADEPMELGVGEDVRLHGVGSGVLVAPGTQPHIVEDAQLRINKAELGWAHAAACVRCGVFLGLRFESPSQSEEPTVTQPPMAHGPRLPEGSLLLPRAFVVRASQEQLQRLELCRAEDIDYVVSTSRARASLRSASSSPHDAASAPVASAPVATPRLSCWGSFGMSMVGIRSHREDPNTIPATAGFRSAQRAILSGHASGSTPAAGHDSEPSDEEEDGGRMGTARATLEAAAGDSPMIDSCAVQGQSDEEPQGKMSFVVSYQRTWTEKANSTTMTNLTLVFPFLGTENAQDSECTGEAMIDEEGMAEKEEDKDENEENAHRGSSTPLTQRSAPAFLPWGIRSDFKEIRCSASGCSQLLSTTLQVVYTIGCAYMKDKNEFQLP